MAYQKLVGQPQRCLIPVPSDTVHIPCPAYFKYNNTNTASGVATTLQLQPSQPSFNVKGVKVGDIIYAETTPGASFVTEIVNSHQLTVEATGIDFSGAGQEFNIWGPERVPCVLMATGAGATNALRVVTQDGVILDTIKAPTLERLPFGQITFVTAAGTTDGAANRGYLAMW